MLISNKIESLLETSNILIIESKVDELTTLSLLFSIFNDKNKRILNPISRADINAVSLENSDIILINNPKIFNMDEKCSLILKNSHRSYENFPFFNIDKIKQIKQNNKINIVFSEKRTVTIDLNCKKIIYILKNGDKFFPAKAKSEFLISNDLVDFVSISNIVHTPQILFYEYINK